MRVMTDEREYTLYLDADGTWVMHTWDPLAATGEQWCATDADVSRVNPFESVVEYDAWR